MKIVAIGDIHGRLLWEEIVGIEIDYDKIIFIGDYFDTRENIKPKQQINNFKNIIQYKKENFEKVVLLIGNHDYHYLKTCPDTPYSNYQSRNAKEISELLHEAIDDELMQMCYIFDNIIFTHAGLSKTWCSNNQINFMDIEKSINDLFINSPEKFAFTMGDNFSVTGNDITQSPIWIRPISLLKDKLENYLQVVGHTPVYYIDPSNKFDITLIDALTENVGQYLIINDGKFEIKDIEI